MKLGAYVQPPHPLKNNRGNKNTINERRDTGVFLPDFGWEEGAAVHRTMQLSQCSIKWRWMTLKSFVINFSEFPNKFSPTVKNGTILFFVQSVQYFLVLSNNSPQRTQIISKLSDRFSLWCFLLGICTMVLNALLMLSLNWGFKPFLS